MKVAGQFCKNYIQSLLRSAYSDMAALASCSRRSQYVNCGHAMYGCVVEYAQWWRKVTVVSNILSLCTLIHGGGLA